MARSSDSPNLGFMVDIETLGTSTESVVVQLAIQPWIMDDESVKIAPMFYDIPIGPQLDMIPARSVSADTLGWWMKQSDAARESINFIGGDFEELKASMLHMIRQFSVIANGQPYEVWARGPQFDIAIIESLLRQCGLSAPWEYNTVRDLRTLMALANLSSNDVPKPAGFVAHHALWDAKFQIDCYHEALRRLWSKA